MTQKIYSVSPKPSVCLKPGTHLPGLRPPDSGDTHVAQVSQPARIPSPSATPFALFGASPPSELFLSTRGLSTRASVLDCDGPTSLFPGRPISRSSHPHGTALFYAVPRNDFFSFPSRLSKSLPGFVIRHCFVICAFVICHFLRVFVDFVGGSSPAFHPHGTALFCAVPRNENFSFSLCRCVAVSPRRCSGMNQK